jgi:hypothetical protein
LKQLYVSLVVNIFEIQQSQMMIIEIAEPAVERAASP